MEEKINEINGENIKEPNNSNCNNNCNGNESNFNNNTGNNSEGKNINNKSNEISDYECSICLDTAKEPVVSKCGHLFCWPCIYSWNQLKKTCPNCNNFLENEKDFVPIYNKNQNKSNTNRFKIPERPKGERNGTENSDSFSSSFNNGANFSFINFFGLALGFPFLGFSFNLNNGNLNRSSYSSNIRTSPLNINIYEDPNLNTALRCLIVILIYIIFSSNFI